MQSADKVPYDIPVPNNMGMVRYVLALGVLTAHFNELAGGDIWWPVSSYNAIGGFFALSGFLLAGSWLRRPRLGSYIKSRALRILPAYWSAVLFFAVTLSLVSSAGDYFHNAQFWKYLAANLSFLNFLQPDLPGVFDMLEVRAVNGSLWTMKVEWFLYLSLPLVSLLLVRYARHPGMVLAAVYLLSVAYRLFFRYLYSSTGNGIYEILSRQFLGQMMYFYSGVFIYYYFSLFMRFRRWLLLFSLVLAYVDYPFYWMQVLIEPLAVTSLVIWFSMVGKWGVAFGKHDNISYNIYLVHFPVVQLCAMYMLTDRIGMTAAFVSVVVATVALSLLLNRCVERPVQRFFHNARSAR